MPEVGVIVVNFGNPDRTIRFVREECPKIQMEHFVVVVDNASTEDSRSRLKESLPGVTVIPNTENVGFARANNQGARYAIDKYGPDYLLFVNNDIVFTDPDVVDQLVKKLSSLPDAGMIGPKVVGLDGKCQSPDPFRSFAQLHLLPYWGKLFYSQKRLSEKLMSDYSEKALEGYHYRIMGSFMLMRTDDFIDCGMMDGNTFLYGEEAILSERLKKMGKGVWYQPAVRVLHEHGATITKQFNRVRRRKLRLESDSYYFKTYLRLSRCQYWAARFTYRMKQILGL